MSQFTIFVPAVDAATKYTITGPDCQILTINLAPMESVEAEPGSLMFMHPSIKSTIRCGKCSRMCTGESICKATYTNGGAEKSYVSLTPNFPSKIVPINLASVGGKLIVKGGAYMSSIGEIGVEASFDCCSCTCCFGGLGAIRQRVTGTGTVFLTAGGTVMTRTLQPNEKFIIDSQSIVGYEESAKFGIQRSGGLCNCCFGGEGLFNTTVTGPGLVIIESMSFDKYKKSMILPKPRGLADAAP